MFFYEHPMERSLIDINISISFYFIIVVAFFYKQILQK